MPRLPIPFNNPRTYAGHSGVDYPQRRGTTFRASGAGRVTSLGYNSRAGNTIWVQYDNGPLVGYAHMDSHAGCPKVGTRVSEGTALGFVGSLGQNSTGPHLHSEVNGHATTAGYWLYFDPNKVVGQKPAGGGSSPAPTPPTPTNPELEELMSLKSAVVISTGGNHPATAFDFDSGFQTSWVADTTYSANVAKVLTEGGSVIVTDGHYNKILADFTKFFADKRAHELLVAKASSGA